MFSSFNFLCRHYGSPLRDHLHSVRLEKNLRHTRNDEAKDCDSMFPCWLHPCLNFILDNRVEAGYDACDDLAFLLTTPFFDQMSDFTFSGRRDKLLRLCIRLLDNYFNTGILGLHEALA
jgi:hypothetical protein